MVIPSALPKRGASNLNRFQSAVTEKAIQPQQGEGTGMVAPESRDVPEYAGLDKEPKEETWYDYFFGPNGEEAKLQQNQKANNQSESREESGRRTSSDAKAENTRSMTVETRPQSEDEQPLPSWLAWLDPTVGSGCADQKPPATSPQLPAQDPNSASQGTAGLGESEELDLSTIQEQQSSTTKASVAKRKKASPPTPEDPENSSSSTDQKEATARRRLIDPPADDPSIDSSVEESKLFQDLDSVPSTKIGTIAGSIKTSDLDVDGSSTGFSVTGSVVDNKIENMKMPRSKAGRTASATSTHRDKAAEKKSLEARRQILVKELRSTIAANGRYDVKTANISAALGDLLDESKQYDQAIKLHRDAVEIYSSKLGDDHTTTMEAKLQLGKVLENAGEHDEAINIYFLVTVMRRAINGEKDPSSADSLVLMANALRKKDDYHQAIKELKRALKIYREALGDAHSKVSTTVDEIASLYVTIGDFEKSAAILEEVVKLKAVTQGMQSKAVASTLCSLATTYECSEDFSKAMKSLKKAYKIYTEMDGYSSKEATNTLNRIAQLYEATGDHDRASIAYLGVLRGRKINFGDDHLLVAETYYKLGHSLRESGQKDKALKCLKEGLPIFVNKGVEINDVEMIAEVMHEMALINKDKKRFNEAARIFKQELGVRRKIGQAEYPMIARTLNHLGVTEYEMKNHNKSLKYLIEALTIFKDRAEGSVECAEVLFNTGLVFEASRNRDRAMEAYDEAARIFKEHGYKENHPHLAKATRKIEKLQSHKNGGLAPKL